jgi:hypothetical protein
MASEVRLPAQVETIEEPALTAFQMEMARRGVDLTLYNLEYFASDSEYTIATYYKERAPGLRGSDPRHRDYEAVISRKEYRVLRVSIAR